MSIPKVFISHASQDKAFFVNNFADRLTSDGIKIWLDQKEISYGENFPNKIFNDGIASASFFIIILSEHSVNSRWVKKELEVAINKEVNNELVIIPIIIGNCEVPEYLRAKHLCKINDVNEYDLEYRYILDRIYNRNHRQALGQIPPKYTNQPTGIDGFNKIDDTIFRELFTYLHENDTNSFRKEDLQSIIISSAYQDSEIESSINKFKGKGFLDVLDFIGGSYRATATTAGSRTFIKHHDDINKIKNMTIASVLNEKLRCSEKIKISIGEKHMHVKTILKILEEKNLLFLSRSISNTKTIAGHIDEQALREEIEIEY